MYKNLENITRWTDTELELLKKYYPALDSNIVAQKVNKSVAAVRTKAAKLGLKKAGAAWTKAQETYLLKNYGKRSVDDIAATVGHSKWGVINKYRLLTNKK